MTDIVERLRHWSSRPDAPVTSEVHAAMTEAAAEIERLRTTQTNIMETKKYMIDEVARLREEVKHLRSFVTGSVA